MNINITFDDTDQTSLDAFCAITGWTTDNDLDQQGWLMQQVSDWLTSQIQGGLIQAATATQRQALADAVTAAAQQTMAPITVGSGATTSPPIKVPPAV